MNSLASAQTGALEVRVSVEGDSTNILGTNVVLMGSHGATLMNQGELWNVDSLNTRDEVLSISHLGYYPIHLPLTIRPDTAIIVDAKLLKLTGEIRSGDLVTGCDPAPTDYVETHVKITYAPISRK
jgi:hypothetical protein